MPTRTLQQIYLREPLEPSTPEGPVVRAPVGFFDGSHLLPVDPRPSILVRATLALSSAGRTASAWGRLTVDMVAAIGLTAAMGFLDRPRGRRATRAGIGTGD
jgi:hypothetical protein